MRNNHHRLCFALALWNGKDPILKERLSGLTNSEGNHGEDIKEYYFYLDSTPTHSYMKHLYKYPQNAYPYGVENASNDISPTTRPARALIAGSRTVSPVSATTESTKGSVCASGSTC
jgi:hypothetical protein